MAVGNYNGASFLMKQSPLVTIVIPTFNSEATIGLVLESIAKQSYPKKSLETLVIDAGSSDETVQIAKKYDVLVLQNKKQHQVYAKHMGHLKARGKYVMHLDSDEVMENPDSVTNKVNLFLSNPLVRAIVPSGHKTPKSVSGANYIINDFGDPFSYYMYGFSFNSRFFVDQLKSKFKIVSEDKDSVVIDFERSKYIPGIEMSASGMVLDLAYINKKFPQVKKYPRLVSQTFFFLVEQEDLVGFTKNDPILHYSASSWGKYLKKLKSRVLNNVFKTEMGKSAFSGRGQYYSLFFKIKKYLFVVYSITFVLPFVVGVKLSLSRKTWVFLAYPYLCLFISYLTLYYMAEKVIGIKPKIKGYGF